MSAYDVVVVLPVGTRASLTSSARSAAAVARANESLGVGLGVGGQHRRLGAPSALVAGGQPAQPGGADLGAGGDPGRQPDLVERAGPVARTELAGVGAEVLERLVGHGAVLVADQPVGRDQLRVELHLRPRVVGDRRQQRGQLVDVEVLGLLVGVDVAVEAVALVGELLHQVVVVVAHAVADRDEVDAVAALLGDRRGDAVGAGHADVGDAVGAEDDDVDAAGTVRRPGLLVAERAGPSARLVLPPGAGGRPRPGSSRSRPPGRRQHHVDGVVERDHRDRVVGPQRLGEQGDRALNQTQPAADVHAAGAVDDQGEVHRRPVLGGQLTRGHRDPHLLGAVVERWRQTRLRPQREVGLGRGRVVVRQRVDPLLGAHGLGRRAEALGGERLGHPERAVVDVEREGRLRVDASGPRSHSCRRRRRCCPRGARVPGRPRQRWRLPPALEVVAAAASWPPSS